MRLLWLIVLLAACAHVPPHPPRPIAASVGDCLDFQRPTNEQACEVPTRDHRPCARCAPSSGACFDRKDRVYCVTSCDECVQLGSQ